MSEVRINLNEAVKVKLTDHGKEIFYHQFDNLNARCGREVCKPHFPAVDADGYTIFQLWDFIRLFGPHIGMAYQNVIMPLEIVYENRTKEDISCAITGCAAGG